MLLHLRAFFSPHFFLCAVISALVPDTCYVMRSENGSCVAFQSKHTYDVGESVVAILDRSGLHKMPKPSASDESATDASASDEDVPDESASAPELEDIDRDPLFPLDGPSLFLEVFFNCNEA